MKRKGYKMQDQDVVLEPDGLITVYFDLFFEEYNFDEDYDEENMLMSDLMKRGILQKYFEDCEREGLKKIEEILSPSLGKYGINNEGHDDNSLICRFTIQQTPDTIQSLYDLIKANEGCENQIDVAPYYVAQGFNLYSYDTDTGNDKVDIEDWNDYIEELTELLKQQENEDN